MLRLRILVFILCLIHNFPDAVISKESDKQKLPNEEKRLADDAIKGKPATDSESKLHVKEETHVKTEDDSELEVDDSDLPDLEELHEDEWPPNGIQLSDDPAKWPGHMHRFGAEGKIHNVDIYKHFPRPSDFFSEHVSPYIPLLMRGAAKNSDAFIQWKSDEYLLALPQGLIYWVPRDQSTNITFRTFMKTYHEENLVFNDEVPSFLRESVAMPPPLLCDPVLKALSSHVLWMSGKDHSINIEKTHMDTLRCVFSGRHELVLVSHIEFGDKMPTDFSSVDVLKVDYKKFPTLREVEYHKVTVDAGDCVYIPTKWYWQANSFGKTKFVDVKWHHKVKSVQPSECPAFSTDPTLGSVTFPDHNSALDNVALHHFSAYLTERKNHTYTSFEVTLKKDKKLLRDMTNWTDEFEEITHDLFSTLDINNDQLFAYPDLEAMTPELVDDLRGLLLDRLADYNDIITDQQDEQKTQKKTQASSVSDSEAMVKDYLNDYMKVLESVIHESIEELSVTGQMPDFQKKLAAKQTQKGLPNIGFGDQGTAGAGKPQTAREEAKAKLKTDSEKKKKETGETEAFEFSEAEENYKVIDDSFIEEILADIEDVDLPQVPTPGSKDQEKPEKARSAEGKTEKKASEGKKKDKETESVKTKRNKDQQKPEKPGGAKETKEAKTTEGKKKNKETESGKTKTKEEIKSEPPKVERKNMKKSEEKHDEL